MATTPEQLARRLEPGELITLYELDLTPKGGIVYYFHDGKGGGEIQFKGHTYSPFPIRAEGFEWNTRGILPRPKLTVSNIGSAISALLRAHDDFVGCKLTQRRTFSRYLTIPLGAEPDNTKEFTPQIFTVERKTSETHTTCSFELSAPWDAEGTLLPGRQILATACPWSYRGFECTYPIPPAAVGLPRTNRLGELFTDLYGPFVAGDDKGLYSAATTYAQGNYAYVPFNSVRIYYVSKQNGNIGHVVTDEVWWWADTCLKKLTDCELHFGELAELYFGGFPGSNKLG